MIDRKKVIKGLELCMNGYCHSGCPYNGINVGCRKQLDADAIAILKGQEKTGVWKIAPDKPAYRRCSACGALSNSPRGNYCRWCGTKMEDGRNKK